MILLYALQSLAALLADAHFLVPLHAVSGAGRLIRLFADQHDVRDMDRRLFLDALTLLSLALRADMALHDVRPLHDDAFGLREDSQHLAALAAVLAGPHFYLVAFLDLHMFLLQYFRSE